jgi:DNA/RNA endonuclease YhcR with UshA esterase domain
MLPETRILKTNRLRRVLLPIAAIGLAACASPVPELSPEEASNHLDAKARVCGVVASAKHATESNGSPTFLNLGQPFPHHIFSAVIWADARARVDYAPESLEGESICVEGVVEEFRKRPQIVVSSPSQIHRVTVERNR